MQSGSRFLGIQSLRAVAALLVVVYHAVEAWGLRFGIGETQPWPNGAAGVDIFFVISGVVMVLSTGRLQPGPAGGGTFLRHRIERIIPMYWLATTVKVGLILTLPALAVHARLSLPYVLESYALLPAHNATGDVAPVLSVGWTLTCEMFFYLLVALTLAIRVPLLVILVPALTLVYLIAAVRQPGWSNIADFAQPIVIEFLYGVAIALTLRRGQRLPPGMAAIVLITGLAIIVTIPGGSSLVRPFSWGLPAAAIVAGTAALEPYLATRLPRWALFVGDSSYSIYLIHAFVVSAVVVAAGRLHLGMTLSLYVFAIASVLGSVAVGGMAYAWLEKPMQRAFRRWAGGTRPSAAVSIAGHLGRTRAG